MHLEITAIWMALGLATAIGVAKQHAEVKKLERGEQEDLHYGNFQEFFHHMLNVSQVMTSIEVMDYFDCVVECLANIACFSFNFAMLPRKDSGRHVCHLLATDKYNVSSSFMSSQEFHHYTFWSPCESFPCQNGGTCRPLYENNTYICECHEENNGTHCEKGWLKINKNAVCFGTSDDSYGTIRIQEPGTIFAFKLVHLSGFVTCIPEESSGTKWGCDTKLNTHITDADNLRLFPIDGSTVFDENLYYTSGFDYQSTEVEFSFISSPLSVGAGQEFRVWYGEDLLNRSEDDNYNSTSCIDIYGLY